MAGKKEHITYHEFVRQVEKGAISPIYLFQGQELFLMEEALELLKKVLVPPESEDFALNKFAAEDANIGELLDLAQTMPFLSKRRVIILTDAQELPTNAQKQMIPYIGNPNASTCLIMTATKLDSRTKFAQALVEQGEVVQFWKLFDRDLPPWIVNRAKRYGYGMSQQTAAYFFEIVGNELRQLDNELKKVIAYANAKEITTAIVQQVVGDVRERDVFELVDAISTGNIIHALKILRQLLIEGEEPLKILAMVTRQIRLLWKAKAWLNEQRGMSAQQLAGKIGVSPRSAEALQQQVQRFSQQKLKFALKRLGSVDRALKSSANAPEIALEDLLLDLCA